MAMTASLKNSTRSYSMFPATESGFSAARARCWGPSASGRESPGSASGRESPGPAWASPPSVIASRTLHP